jgi:hypothetical protein
MSAERTRVVYFESTEGGMEVHDPFRLDRPCLYGWMNDSCREDDSALARWVDAARVGESYQHRLGVAVCLKDEESAGVS